jgi:hypothetical protein
MHGLQAVLWIWSQSREPRSRNLIASRSQSQNYELRPRLRLRLLSFTTNLKKLQVMVAEEVFENCTNFNLIT